MKKNLILFISILLSTIQMQAKNSQENHPYKKQNIFNQQDYDNIVVRISTISDSSAKQWGIMNVSEMLLHCNVQLKLALHEIEGKKHEGSFILRTAFGRWLGLYGPKWKKGAVTPTQMNIRKQNLPVGQFATEKKLLLDYLKVIITKDNFQEHPIFGKLNKKDWGRLIWKHLDHHLRQFNG